MKLIVATNNEGKIKEYKELFKDFNIEVLSIKDIDANIDIEENGTTYKENALIKARMLSKITNELCIGDDSGLSITALPGELGLHTARFMGDIPYNEKIKEVLKRMKGITYEERSATFNCTIALCHPDGREEIFEGIRNGYISEESYGTGFGYDPIFYVPEYNKTYGEMDLELKNKISHRGGASEKLKEYMNENFK